MKSLSILLIICFAAFGCKKSDPTPSYQQIWNNAGFSYGKPFVFIVYISPAALIDTLIFNQDSTITEYLQSAYPQVNPAQSVTYKVNSFALSRGNQIVFAKISDTANGYIFHDFLIKDTIYIIADYSSAPLPGFTYNKDVSFSTDWNTVAVLESN